MTQEEFIKVLDREGYSYEIEGDKLVVTVTYKGERENVNLQYITSLPPGVEFSNRGSVDLSALTSLPPGVEFRNGGDVDLRSLIGRQFNYWNGNIKRIASKRLLNVMIKQGVFI